MRNRYNEQLYNAAQTRKGWESLAASDKVDLLVDVMDGSRMDRGGGYPSQYVIENGKVYWAHPDDGKDGNAVALTVLPVEAFIESYGDIITDRFASRRRK